METMNTHSNEEKRIVSFFIWDPELERKINCEVKMIDGISKLLNVVTTIEQTIECHKALVLSQQRMLAFMTEIQRKQQNLLQSDKIELEPTKATIILSDIHLPLVWTNIKAKSEQKKFAVFCLARIGCEIIDTQLKSIDKQSTEIIFTDKLIFENVPHNFQLNLQIYALNKSLALSSSAKDFANRYSYFSRHGSPTFSRKFPGNNHKSSHEQQSKFILIAQTIFTNESSFNMSKVQSLKIEPIQFNPLMQLPIHTSFSAHFIVQPLCYTRLATFAGIVEVYNLKYSCILTAGFLNGEEIMQDDFTDQHRFSLSITSDTIILSNDDHLSFSIYNHGFDQEEFFVQDLFTLKNWIRALQQHIVDMRAWQMTFEHRTSIKRCAYQPLISSPVSSIRGRNLTNKPMLTTRSRSLDNLYQTDISSPSLVMNLIDPSKRISLVSDQVSSDEEENDESKYHTRL